jgi:hypothetical protein
MDLKFGTAEVPARSPGSTAKVRTPDLLLDAAVAILGTGDVSASRVGGRSWTLNRLPSGARQLYALAAG